MSSLVTGWAHNSSFLEMQNEALEVDSLGLKEAAKGLIEHAPGLNSNILELQVQEGVEAVSARALGAVALEGRHTQQEMGELPRALAVDFACHLGQSYEVVFTQMLPRAGLNGAEVT